MAEQQEQEIVIRALNRDAAALEQLVFLRYDWLIAVAKRKIPRDLYDIVDARDVVQDAVMKIFHGFGTFRPTSEGALFQWMKTIVQNVAIDHLRKLSTGPTVLKLEDDKIDALMGDLAFFGPTVSMTMGRKELARAVAIAMDKMEPHYRRTIQLLYLESKTLAEAANIMQKSEQTVRGYRQRAREQLKKSIIRLSLYV